jgi:hypothetical protein
MAEGAAKSLYERLGGYDAIAAASLKGEIVECP